MIANLVLSEIDKRGLFAFLREVESEFREIEDQTRMVEVHTKIPGCVHLCGCNHEIIVFVQGEKLMLETSNQDPIEIQPDNEGRATIAKRIICSLKS